jgi:hypothetical protein
MIPSGADRFKDIGMPHQQTSATTLSAADVVTIQQKWLAAAAEVLPEPLQKDQPRSTSLQHDQRYQEGGEQIQSRLPCAQPVME